MSIMRKTLLAVILVLAGTSAAPCQTVSSRGLASLQYAGRINPQVKAEAMAAAKLKALESYVAESGPAKARIFETRRAEIAKDVDRFLLATVVLSEEDDKARKAYTVSLRAEVNAALLAAFLDGGSAVATAAPGERSMLTFLFVARMQDSVQAFDDKVYKRTDSKSSQGSDHRVSEQTRESESFRSNSVSTAGSARNREATVVESSSATTTGGSTTRRSDAVSWKVANAAEANSVITGSFSAAGFEVVEAEYVESESGGLLNVANVRRDFSKGDDLAPQTLRDTAAGIRKAGIPYFAVGTLDVGLRDTDPGSGNVRVFVTVTGKVMDLTGRFPRTVSSVGPVQFAGLGPSETVARTNAIRTAAGEAARQMIDELNLKSVR